MQSNLLNLERVDSVQTSNVEGVLLRIRTALVMGVNAAIAAEIVLGCARIELV
jgi:hypothetical protein